jgi:hypothetical protein
MHTAFQPPIDAQYNITPSAELLHIRHRNPVVYESLVYTIQAFPQGTSVTVEFIFVITNGSVIMKQER